MTTSVIAATGAGAATTTSAAEELASAGRSDRGAAGARLSELFARHGATVLGLCRILLRQPEEAEDAVQQTFLSAYRSLLNGVEPRHPAAWLATIARNECRARIEQRMREPLLDPEAEPASPLPDPVAAAAARADLGSLWLAIANLPRRQRKALVLREFSGLSYGELAVALGVSEPTVESLLFRARRNLRRRLRPAASFAFAPLTAIREALMGWGVAKVASGVAVIAVAGGTVAAVESGPVRPVVPAADAATRPQPAPPSVAAARPLVPRPRRARPAATHPRRVVHVKVVVTTALPPRPALVAVPVRTVAAPPPSPRPADPPSVPVAAAPEPPPVRPEESAAAPAPAPEPWVPAEEPTTTEAEAALPPEPLISEDNSGPGSTESSNEGPGGSGSDDGGSSPNEGHGSESSGSGHDGGGDGDEVDHSGHGSADDGSGSGGGRGPG